jgi:hypothetical protein
MKVSTSRGSRILLASMAPLLWSACQAPPPALKEWDIPAGRTLVRDGLAPGGDLVVATDDSPERCRAPQAWTREGDHWREVAQGPALPRDACPRITAQLAGDGRTLAVHDYSAGRAEVLAVEDGRIAPMGMVSIRGEPGSRFPPPGPNLALASDGQKLLLGSINRGCRALPDGGRGCGQAELFEMRAGTWKRIATIVPVAELAARIRFGESVALDPAGGLAVVGGTGEPDQSGALGVYKLDRHEPRLVQTLTPSKPMWGFATDLSLSGDGRRLAVGGGHSVHVYERTEDGFALDKVLVPPDLTAGYFGETVALSLATGGGCSSVRRARTVPKARAVDSSICSSETGSGGSPAPFARRPARRTPISGIISR